MPTLRCPGPIRRREFLRIGALALGGMGLPELLKARAAAGASPPDTSVILFWMWGGPSQLETWDCKPDAPSEYRGPLRPIHTTVPGLDLALAHDLEPSTRASAKAAVRFCHGSPTVMRRCSGSSSPVNGRTITPC